MSQFPPSPPPRGPEHGYIVGRALCRALDLDPNSVASITLTASASDVATVEIVRYISREETQEVERILSRYSLTADPDV